VAQRAPVPFGHWALARLSLPDPVSHKPAQAAAAGVPNPVAPFTLAAVRRGTGAAPCDVQGGPRAGRPLKLRAGTARGPRWRPAPRGRATVRDIGQVGPRGSPAHRCSRPPAGIPPERLPGLFAGREAAPRASPSSLGVQGAQRPARAPTRASAGQRWQRPPSRPVPARLSAVGERVREHQPPLGVGVQHPRLVRPPEMGVITVLLGRIAGARGHVLLRRRHQARLTAQRRPAGPRQRRHGRLITPLRPPGPCRSSMAFMPSFRLEREPLRLSNVMAPCPRGRRGCARRAGWVAKFDEAWRAARGGPRPRRGMPPNPSGRPVSAGSAHPARSARLAAGVPGGLPGQPGRGFPPGRPCSPGSRARDPPPRRRCGPP